MLINKFVWLVVSCLLVITLILASCGQAAEEEEEVLPPAAEEEEEEAPPPAEEEEEPPASKVPRYGGVLIEGRPTEPLYFDEVQGYQGPAWTLNLTNEELLMGDWAKGPGGTGEANWILTIFSVNNRTGMLAETWEIPDEETLIFHIRKGVHWHNKPPVNGRELVADDVVFSLNRLWDTPTALQYYAYPRKANIQSITAPDKWTVIIKVFPGKAGQIFKIAGDLSKIIPPELIETYGDMSDWRIAVGTGPFLLVDYVTQSSVTFERNPNYWGNDPLHTEYQLPYLDGVKALVIPDLSTRLAALRTGKIDHVAGIEREDAEQLIRMSPQLKYFAYNSATAPTLFMRTDNPPFNDIRVRQALAMAIDNQAIADSLYGGKADMLTWPVSNIPEFADAHVPLNQLPESVRFQFEYHPDRARQLLTEAGYPNGFKTEVVCYQAQVDLLAIAKEYFADVGVDFSIQVKEYAAWNSTGINRGYDQMYMQYTVGYQPDVLGYTIPKRFDNFSIIDDETINEAKKKIDEAYFNETERNRVIRELVPYALEQAYMIQFPAGYSYIFWQPWIMGYHGELMIGYANVYDFTKYVWLDQDLKEKMTGMR